MDLEVFIKEMIDFFCNSAYEMDAKSELSETITKHLLDQYENELYEESPGNIMYVRAFFHTVTRNCSEIRVAISSIHDAPFPPPQTRTAVPITYTLTEFIPNKLR